MKDVYTLDDLLNWPAATEGVEPPIRLSVFGDPVAHSASPPMHNAGLEACGIPARYCRLHILPDQLTKALRAIVANGFIGTNVTIPHKTAVLPILHEVDENARRIGAVNTIAVDGERLLGFNTDGPGLVRALRSDFSVDLRDMRVMLLGAGGGAGRAIAVQCGLENCERLVLVNRTAEKAEALIPELESYFTGSRLVGPAARLQAIPWEERAMREQLAHTDLIINCTNIGMKPTDSSPIPAAWLSPSHLVYDTIYTAPRTPLMRAADEVGGRAANGLSMLLHQGALSFEIWFNREAPIAAMRRGLEQAVQDPQKVQVAR